MVSFSQKMKGTVQTVLGKIDPKDLGVVLPHEHFQGNLPEDLRAPALNRPEMGTCDFLIENLGWIRQNPYSHHSNTMVKGAYMQKVLEYEIERFKAAGGGTIVDNTPEYRGRGDDTANFDKKLSKATGVHIVLGTGYYVTQSQSKENLTLTCEQMCKKMRNDIVHGQEADDGLVKCGIIGEIGCSSPLTEFEKKVLRSSAEIENELGPPVMIHPGRETNSPEESLRIFLEAGGHADRLVMAHLDRTFFSHESVLEFAKFGTYLEYDLFGIETSYYQQNTKVFMPSDGQRIEFIKKLIEEGYEDRILLSHDIHTKHRFETYGGHGLSHILVNVLPMMRSCSISQQVIDKMTIYNPARWLTFTK